MGGLSSARKQGKTKLERGGRRARLGLCAATAVAGSCAGATARLSSIYRQPKAVRTGENLGGVLCPTTTAQRIHGLEGGDPW